MRLRLWPRGEGGVAVSTAETITAETITDEQIRDLRILIVEEQTFERWPDGVGSMMNVTDLALQGAVDDKRCPTPAAVRHARARCAEILNARAKLARPKLCPVCRDGACETKSMECGK